jgi:glycerol-3-phosphate dehydrogenase
VICDCEPVLEAEVRHVIRHEWARSVDDVSRRTRLGTGACGGMRCALSCGRLLAEERGMSPEQGRDSAARFLRAAFRRRLPVLAGEQARQEALGAAHLHAQAGIDLSQIDSLPPQLALDQTRSLGEDE